MDSTVCVTATAVEKLGEYKQSYLYFLLLILAAFLVLSFLCLFLSSSLVP